MYFMDLWAGFFSNFIFLPFIIFIVNLPLMLVTAIWYDFMLHWLAGRMQVVGFPLADADVVAPGQGKQTKFVPVGPHFIENWCEVADPREDLFTNIGVDVLDADLQAATLT